MRNSRFVIQFHQARTEHYDLRLELDGVLKSWAIPKAPPARPGVKRLAIQTEDHALEYIDFEGEIQEGHYGAGRVKIWDSGTFELESRRDEKLVFILNGGKLKGAYVLLRFRPMGEDAGGGREKGMWLFFKRKD